MNKFINFQGHYLNLNTISSVSFIYDNDGHGNNYFVVNSGGDSVTFRDKDKEELNNLRNDLIIQINCFNETN